MSTPELPAFTRREFIGRSLTLASASLAAPYFIQRSALGLPMAATGMTSIPGAPEDRVLVVIQLSGGNDGLNTVVPFSAPEYYRARPSIGVRENRVLTLGDGLGLHPGLGPVKSLYDDGLCALINGVGYPNPNRSHFKSMDIWHTADTSGTGDGWLGRYFDSECCGFGAGEGGRTPAQNRGRPALQSRQRARQPGEQHGGAALQTNPEDPQPSFQGQPGIAVGRSAPLAMQGRRVKPISFETEELFRWTGREIHPSLEEPYERITRHGDTQGLDPHSNAAFLTRTALDAQVSSDLIRKAVRLRPLVEYPRSRLGQELAMVSSMIRAGLPTRVYYVSIGGFDTHAGQGGEQGRHAQLLTQLAQAVRAFYRDLSAQENDGRVLTMTFSEFGRRVGQNASGGTDHGTAAPMFLFGPMVRPGLHGSYPPMDDLEQGDLKYQVDFRSVYAAILEDWMRADSKLILEGSYRALPVIRKG